MVHNVGVYYRSLSLWRRVFHPHKLRNFMDGGYGDPLPCEYFSPQLSTVFTMVEKTFKKSCSTTGNFIVAAASCGISRRCSQALSLRDSKSRYLRPCERRFNLDGTGKSFGRRPRNVQTSFCFAEREVGCIIISFKSTVANIVLVCLASKWYTYAQVE